MKYTQLGNTGIEVSRICVGCMSYGKPSEDFHLWTLNQEETTKMIKHALDLGVNFFDTANVYSHGTSEEFLGKALKDLGVARDQVVLASKVYFNEGKLSAAAIRREIDGTLQRLGTDYLDLYQIHRFDYGTPIEETMQALHELVRSGKVRAIGASAMYGYQFHNMQICAERNGWTLFSTLQNHYNLLYREDERELIPVAKQYCVSRVAHPLLSPRQRTPHPQGVEQRVEAQRDRQGDAQQIRPRHGERYTDRRPRGGGGGASRRDDDGSRVGLAAEAGCRRAHRGSHESAALQRRGPRLGSRPQRR